MEQLPLTASEIELVYKTKIKASDRPKIAGVKDAYHLLLKTWNENKLELQEEFKILLLNRAHYVLGIYDLSSGGVTGTIADPKLIFAAALKSNACSIVLAHNHPSGDLSPSRADEDLTRKLSQGGRLLDIMVLDHIIITKHDYYSFADHGLMM